MELSKLSQADESSIETKNYKTTENQKSSINYHLEPI